MSNKYVKEIRDKESVDVGLKKYKKRKSATEYIIPLGSHIGTRVKNVKDLDYLVRFIGKINNNSKLRYALKKQIMHLEKVIGVPEGERRFK